MRRKFFFSGLRLIPSSSASASATVCRPSDISRESWLTAATRSRWEEAIGICSTRANRSSLEEPEVRKIPLERTKALSDSTP